MKHFYTYKKRLIYCLLFVFALQPALAQNVCPPNIDFEFGDFTNWQCYTGTTNSTGTGFPPNCIPGVNTVNAVPSAPIPGRHTIIPPSQNTDPFGGFYITPGSSATTTGTGKVARLGFVGQTGALIERLSYTFTIPSSATTYSLQYKYAVVYQDPNHCQDAQPHFEAKVFDVTTGQYINCASFEYYATPGQNGFTQSTNTSQGIVYYKNWTPVTFILSDYIGHTIRVEFTNADCTQTGHWAYCYVDVSNNCSSPVIGGKFCSGDPSVSLIAPYDYQAYNWYYTGFGTPISTSDTLTLTPPPLTPTPVAVEVIPYPGLGCRDTIWTTIIPLPPVPVNAGVDRLICPTGITFRGPDTLGASSSSTNYTYSWVPTAGLSDPAIAQPAANPLATTNYVLTMTDTATGCVRKDTVIVTVAEPVTATYSVNAPNQCLANNNFQFTSSPTNPAGTIYAWLFDGTNGSSQANPSYVYPAAGNYLVSLTTTTGAGCSDTSSQAMIVSAEAIANAGSDQTLCSGPGASTVIGSASLTGYSYSWSPSAGLSSTTIAQPIAAPATTTTYIVTATAPGGCFKKDTVVVSIVPTLSAAFTVNNPTQCLNVNNYQFIMTSPLPGLTYSWNFGEIPGVNSTQQNPANVYTTAGTFTVKVNLLSPSGCKDSSTQTVTVHPTPAGTISAADTNICEGTPVVLNVTGSTAGSYKWYLNTTTLLGTTTTPSYNASQPGIYTVTLENNGCVNNGTGAVTLTITRKPTVDFTIESSCLGRPTVFTDASYVSGSLPVDYLWNFGGGLPSSTQPSPTVTYPNAGTYNVQFTVTPQACASLATTATKPVTVKGPTPNTRYTDKAALEGVSLQLQARNIGTAYSWSPGTNLNNANIMAPIFQGMTEIDYTITITDNLGCTTVDSQLVKVFKEVNIFMPKAFTPNGDGQNDRIVPFTIGIKQVRLFRVINRWGVIVYEARNNVNGWDGTYKGAPQPMDGYVWEIQAVDYFGKNHTRQGSFTLIR